MVRVPYLVDGGDSDAAHARVEDCGALDLSREVGGHTEDNVAA